MSRKICFVAMGFGKKMDYRNSKEVDLDIIYKKVIKNLFDSLTEYELIRADEISGSEIIDVSMYSLLLKADLVIADITTMNENAIYELGIRHASKPFSTIIMMQESEKIPFDLNHCRILTYKDFGEVLDDEEAEKIKTNLHSFIKASSYTLKENMWKMDTRHTLSLGFPFRITPVVQEIGISLPDFISHQSKSNFS